MWTSEGVDFGLVKPWTRTPHAVTADHTLRGRRLHVALAVLGTKPSWPFYIYALRFWRTGVTGQGVHRPTAMQPSLSTNRAPCRRRQRTESRFEASIGRSDGLKASGRHRGPPRGRPVRSRLRAIIPAGRGHQTRGGVVRTPIRENRSVTPAARRTRVSKRRRIDAERSTMHIEALRRVTRRGIRCTLRISLRGAAFARAVAYAAPTSRARGRLKRRGSETAAQDLQQRFDQ